MLAMWEEKSNIHEEAYTKVRVWRVERVIRGVRFFHSR